MTRTVTPGPGNPSDSAGGRRSGEVGDDGDGGDQSTAQRLVTVLSLALTLVIFAALVWQAVTAPAGQQPRVSVVDTTALSDGNEVVTVAVENPAAVGFESVTVDVGCTDPPVTETVEHVPAGDRRAVHVVCPDWNGSASARVRSWTEL